jgi:hypothetical protein
MCDRVPCLLRLVAGTRHYSITGFFLGSLAMLLLRTLQLFFARPIFSSAAFSLEMISSTNLR